MKILILCVALLGALSVKAQSVKELLETGNSLMQGGDFANAINVLNKAYQKDATNLEVIKSLAYAYYLNKNYAESLSIIKPVLDTADDQSFQIAGNIYVALAENKDADKLYKQALKRFPNSGPLYSDYGIFLGSLARQYEAIKVWEKGIEMDPSFPGNYYYASKFYYNIDVLWSVIYGEVFVDMESLTRRTPEIKALLMDSYKKLFSGDGMNLQPMVDKKGNAINPFENAVRATFRANASAVAEGVNVETLTSLRSRFILEWFNKYATRFPYHLFDYQRQLLQQGMFDAYNQWIFGFAQDEKAYDAWVSAHQSEFTTYNTFARGRVFKIPQGEYYQTKEKE